MYRYSLYLLLLLSLSCGRGDDQLDCPGQGDRAVDVLSGPSSILFNSEIWAFLSNEYGGRGELIRVTGYPFFLNWEGGCQDEYAVNLINFQYDFTSLTTYWKYPVGESVRLRPDLLSFFDDFSPIAPPRVTITNVPDFRDLELTAQLHFGSQFDANTRTLQIDISLEDRWRGGRYAYLTLWDEAAGEHRAILIDLQEGGQYDYLIQSLGMSWQQISVAEEVNYIGVQEVIDPTSGEWVFVGEQLVDNGTAEFLVLAESRPYLISIFSDGLMASHRWAQNYYPELPELVDFPKSPILKHDYVGEKFTLTTTDPIYLSVVTEELEISGNKRILRGVIPAGQHTLRTPDLPPSFRERYPQVDLPLNISDNGYEISFWHYPGAATAADYWRLLELDGLDKELYYYERIVVN